MRKKHYGVLLIVYILLFVNLFFVFREKDISNFHNNFGYHQIEENKDGFISFVDSNFDKKELINKLNKISKELDIAFLIPSYVIENDEIIRFNNYFIGNERLLSKLLPKDSKIDFDDFNNGVYISNKNKDNAQKILTFYEVEYNIYPIDKIVNDDSNIYSINFFYDENDIDINNKIKDGLDGFSFNMDVYNRQEYDSKSGIIINLIKSSVIMIILSIVSCIFFISNNMKNIGIYKLNGIKKIYVWKKVYLKYLSLSIILSFLIPIIGYFILFRSVFARVLDAIIVTIIAGLLLSFFNLIVSIFFINYIGKMRLSEILKGRSINNKLITMTYILVVVTGISILPIINENVFRISEGIKFLSEKSFSIKDHSNYSILNLDYDIENDKDIEELVNEIDKLDALIKFEPTAIFSSDINSDDRYLAFFINEKYFDMQSFKFEDKKVDLNSNKDVIVFMHKETFKMDNWSIDQFIFTGGTSAEIKLFDDISFENYSDELVDRYLNEIPIFIYNKCDKSFSKENIFIDNSKLNEVLDVINKNGFSEHMTLKNGKDILNDHYKNAFSYFMILIVSILPYIVTYYAISKSLFDLIYINSIKKWTIKIIFGYSRFKLYLDILKDVLIICLSLLLSKIIYQAISIYSIVTLVILLVVVYCINIHRINKIKVDREVFNL